MITKNDDYPVRIIFEMKGGKGDFVTKQIIFPEVLEQAERLLVRGKLALTHSVGIHKHKETMDNCYVLGGSGLVKDAECGEVRLEKRIPIFACQG